MRSPTRFTALTLLLVLLSGCAGATAGNATPGDSPTIAASTPTIASTTAIAASSTTLISRNLPSLSTPTGTPPPAPAAPTTAFACAATLPNGSTPPGEQPASIHHGNGALWVALWPEGRVVIPADSAKPDGALAMKFPWWRGSGVRGNLTIAGRRLDAPAPPLAANIPDGYGDTGFQSTAILFPTVGCWEVTGQAGDASLTFVTLVVKLDPVPVTSTPTR